MDRKQKIDNFLLDLEESEGFLPKFAHSQLNNKKIFYSGPVFDKEEMSAAIEALLFSKWASSGEYVDKFEKQFSKVINQKESVMVNSGSSANLVMVAALKEYFGWDDDDEIIISVVGFPTTTSSVYQNRLKPVFVDIEFDTLNFNLDLIEAKITSKTRAVFLSPVLGNPPDIDKLLDICDKYNLQLILDGCDSLGSKWKNKDLTEYAIASSCSFYVAHHISSVEGGAVSSNNSEIVKLARSFASWGRACFCSSVANFSQNGCCGKRFSCWLPQFPELTLDHRYLFDYMGWNLKPLDLCGAIGSVQLKKLPEINQKRNINKTVITDFFRQNIPNLKFPLTLEYSNPAWFGTATICSDKNQKETLVKYLENNNIQTRNYFAGNLLVHKGYSHLGDWREYPEANKVLERVFFVGCSPTYTNENLNQIENVLINFKNV